MRDNMQFGASYATARAKEIEQAPQPPVNVYLIQDDGESKCWQARTAQDAISAACRAFCKEIEEGGVWEMDELPHDYWHRTCFESCSLIGELANPLTQRTV